MKKLISFAASFTMMALLNSCHSNKQFATEAPSAVTAPMINNDFSHTKQLLANAMRFTEAEHGMIDPLSGYPVEGWNQDPERGLFLRSFTQLSAIGEWLELEANVLAGYCDTPSMSRQQAFEHLELTVKTLLADQANPELSAKGLLVNFLDLGNGSGKRVGPLGEKASKDKFIASFDNLDGLTLWNDLATAGWLDVSADGSWANIRRSATYGSEHFIDGLAKYHEQRYQIMDVLDKRVVNIIFGDNVNLTASAAKAIGALLHPEIKDDSRVIAIRQDLQRFIDLQKPGYDFMLDKKTQSFLFGWDATNDTYTGWDVNGVFKEAHMNSFINEFRGPWTFTVLNYNLDVASLANASFKIKPYRSSAGKDIYSLSTWDGSAFQFFGLTNFMRDQDNPAWDYLLNTAASIELDYSNSNQLPGFLSESYTGHDTEYTGHVGIADVAISDQPRINDTPSLYTLGVVSMYKPTQMELFLKKNWETISSLFTDHGPWEGYAKHSNSAIEFQTSAHTLALTLGLINSGPENMQRYLDAHVLNASLDKLYKSGKPLNFLSDAVSSNSKNELNSSNDEAISFEMNRASNLSNGRLILKYSSEVDAKAVLSFHRAESSVYGKTEMANEIYLNLPGTGKETKSIEITLPATASLHDIKSLSFRVREGALKHQLKAFRYVPFANSLN